MCSSERVWQGKRRNLHRMGRIKTGARQEAAFDGPRPLSYDGPMPTITIESYRPGVIGEYRCDCTRSTMRNTGGSTSASRPRWPRSWARSWVARTGRGTGCGGRRRTASTPGPWPWTAPWPTRTGRACAGSSWTKDFRGRAWAGGCSARPWIFSREQRFPRVHLWTFQGLDAARKLYEKNGFTLVEEHSFTDWGSPITEQKFELIP